MHPRQSTGIAGLDDHLGGGLVPGTLTVVVGATGIGKTQAGLQFAASCKTPDDARDVVLDVAPRAHSQNHSNYTARIAGWPFREVPASKQVDLADFFRSDSYLGDYQHVFDYRGQRVTRQDLDWDQWREWQTELNIKLRSSIAFLYRNFVDGCRRVVVDGVEPADRPHESIQLNLFEYAYHQIVRKDPEWVARALFREQYRVNAAAAAEHRYDPAAIGCVLLLTSREAMLEDLIARPLDEGDALSNANTLIYMGKVRAGKRVERALYIAKHRGSACAEEILTYRIGDAGVEIVR